MKLPEVKSSHFFVLTIIAIIIFGTIIITKQNKQNELLMRLLSQKHMSSKAKGKSDPYERSVKNQILKIYPLLKNDYQDFISRKPKRTDGKVILDWTIDTSGRPTKVQVVMSELNDSQFHLKIVEKVRKLRFPEPPFKKYITHTFKFKDVKNKGKKN